MPRHLKAFWNIIKYTGKNNCTLSGKRPIVGKTKKGLTKQTKYKAVVMGVSAGGLRALNEMLPNLPADLPYTIITVIHRAPDADDYLERSLNAGCHLRVKQAEDKEKVMPGTVYFAPPNFHLLVEDDWSLSLSVDGPVNYARPSIDVLFESAADAYGPALAGIILTGANTDGSKGLSKIQKMGGLVVVQDPATAEVPAMPLAAIAAVKEPIILPLHKMAFFLKSLGMIQTTE
jgi:two-component system chemotaxis response regulator CheB